jgi:hypothetical protein
MKIDIHENGGKKMGDLSFLIPWLPFIGTIILVIPVYFLMRLNAKKLKSDIDQIKQAIKASKTGEVKDQVTALEGLERLVTSTSDELEKSLQKSVTVRNLQDKINMQDTQIVQQHDVIVLQTQQIEKLSIDLASEHSARIIVEGQVIDLQNQLAGEKQARQTAVLEIESLKSYSANSIQKLKIRVKFLEEFILRKEGKLPDGLPSIEEA